MPKNNSSRPGDRPDGVVSSHHQPWLGRGQLSWAIYEWARNPYFTLVLIFIFAPYFANHVVGDPVTGQVIWGYIQGIVGAIIAVISPVLGAIADASGRRKAWVGAFTVLSIPCVAALWLASPGGLAPVALIGLALIAASVFLEFAAVFHNAMLPALVSRDRVGSLSGFGFALGNVGGISMLIIVLAAFTIPDVPILGLEKADHEHDRVVGPITAFWLVLFSAPFFLFTPDVPGPRLAALSAIRRGLGNLRKTLRDIRSFRDFALYLIARMTYNDGLLTLQAFGGIYAAGTFGWNMNELGVFGIILILSAAVGGMIGGWIDDRIGSKRTILFSLMGLVIVVVGFVSITKSSLFFGYIAVAETDIVDERGTMLFSSISERVFIALGILSGLLFGPCFASSRTMVARVAPESRVAEFYGLYALSGTITAFVGPLAVSALTAGFESQRVGFSAIIVFLLGGLLLLLPVRETRVAG
jgi:UMF1 family MFS transporter